MSDKHVIAGSITAGPAPGTGVRADGTDPYSALPGKPESQTPVTPRDYVAETKLAETKRYAEVRSGNNKAHTNKTKRRAIAAMVKKSKRRNK